MLLRTVPIHPLWEWPICGCHAGGWEQETGFWWGREVVEAETAAKGMGSLMMDGNWRGVRSELPPSIPSHGQGRGTCPRWSHLCVRLRSNSGRAECSGVSGESCPLST